MAIVAVLTTLSITTVAVTSKIQVTMAFSVGAVLSMCFNGDFGPSEDESNCDEGEEVHAYLGLSYSS